MNRLAEEKAAQETYEVMLWKCEYIGAFAGVRQDLMTAGDQFLADTTALYAAAKQAKLTLPASTRACPRRRPSASTPACSNSGWPTSPVAPSAATSTGSSPRTSRAAAARPRRRRFDWTRPAD